MDNLSVLTKKDKQVNEEKHPPRVCPRCDSENTKFCYYNNYNVSQPRYFCKNCRRHWTHGGTLRNIPIGGSCRKPKRPKVDQSLVSRMVYVENQPINDQPLLHVQENNEFVGSFGGSSSSVVGNHFSPLPEIHGVANVSPIRTFRPMDCLKFYDTSLEQDYYNVGSNDLIGNPLINQSIGGYDDNHNGYYINQVDQHKWNNNFNNTMDINYKASTSGNRGPPRTEMNKNNNNIKNNCLFRSSSYQLEKHGL